MPPELSSAEPGRDRAQIGREEPRRAPADSSAARLILGRRLEFQAAGCDLLGSPFYASLLRRAVTDLESEGVVWDALRGYEGEDGHAALALRLMGAVHRLVLLGDLPVLAAHYPSVGGDGDADAPWPAFRAALRNQRPQIREGLARGCQTNEVGRSAALLGGFLEVAHRTGLPPRILEIGASAGLNLQWDRYRYESGTSAWGERGSPVRFDSAFDVPPPLEWCAAVIERKGCDLEPIDSTSVEGSLTLRSFTWPDQLDRLRRLEGAIEVARRYPVEVERLDAATFLERELAELHLGVATVVFHSVFMQYLDAPGRERVDGAIEAACAQSSREAPLAWLRMEPANGVFEVHLNLWPGGGDELIAVSHAHGTRVRWLVSSGSQ